jgi:hypothetical protein
MMNWQRDGGREIPVKWFNLRNPGDFAILEQVAT